MYTSYPHHPARAATGLLGPWCCALLTACAWITGCTEPAPLVDPCAGEVGTCVTLDVEGMVGNLDSIQFTLTGEFTHQFNWPYPGGPGPLPVEVAVPIPQATAGTLLASAVGSLSGVIVASGQGSLVVAPGMHQQLPLQMMGLSGPSCTNGTRDGNETDVDCGGGTCPPCGTGKMCGEGHDCQGQVCHGGTCTAPTCTDHVKNGNETDVDCGGGTCPACAGGQMCQRPADCGTGFCSGGVCVLASCTDRMLDGHETDVDCGGPDCAPCGDGKMCQQPTDCQSRYCEGGTCATATCTDHVKNGNETDVDCGGGTCPPCAVGKMCQKTSDCNNSICDNGVCTQATCNDGMKDGNETDVDCGGPVCMKCAAGKGCLRNSDCTTGSCCTSGGCPLNKCLAALTLSFKRMGPFAVGTGPKELAVGDFNGDGKVDAACTNYGLMGEGNTVSVLLGTGDGSFRAAASVITGNGDYGITAGDWNGDGRLDLATASFGGGTGTTLSVLLGQGTGTFGAPASYTTSSGPHSVAAADFNGDGHPDLVAVGTPDLINGNVSVLLNKGNGTFATAKNTTLGIEPNFVLAGDWNGDGRIDLAVSDDMNSVVYILLGQGNGTFGAPSSIPGLDGPWGLATGDLNGDGHPDLVAANNSTGAAGTTVGVMLGNGNGTFQSPVTGTVGIGPIAVAVADLNGDGKLDVVSANYGTNTPDGNTVSVLLGKGDGTLQTQQTFVVGSSPRDVAVADLNGDGRPDLIITGYSSNDVTVLLNTSH